MEKDVSRTGQVGSSSGLFLSSSTSLSPLLDYQYGSQYFSMHEADLMMMASSSRQKELLMDLLSHQSLVDHHSKALFQLKEKLKEAQDLEKENYNLNIINADLINCLAVHQKAASDKAALFRSSTMSMDPKKNLNEALTGSVMTSLGSEVHKGLNLDNVASEREFPSPTPTRDMMDSGQLEGSGEGLEDRVSLPKSISVRSRAYSKKIHPGRSHGGRGDKHKDYVQGEEKEENSFELDVYKQGMSKTELCNKWQETGSCLYEEKCQFSHGIEELRPVIRHPRYKSDVCRMVLNGDPCNYGHRCHFRHSLSEQEELMRSNNLRILKPLNQ